MSSPATLPHRCAVCSPRWVTQGIFRGSGHHKAAWIITIGSPEKALKDSSLKKEVGRHNVVGRAANEAGWSQGCLDTVGGAALQLESTETIVNAYFRQKLIGGSPARAR